MSSSGDESDAFDEDYVPEEDKEADTSSSSCNELDVEEAVSDVEENGGSQTRDDRVAAPSKSRKELWLEFLGHEIPKAEPSNELKDDSKDTSKYSPKVHPEKVELIVQNSAEGSFDVQQHVSKLWSQKYLKLLARRSKNLELLKIDRLWSSVAASTGFCGVLSELGKKRRIGTLEKSKIDWELFKKKSKIEDELQQHNRGKGGFLDKQEFLQRVDYKQFEKERDLRNSARKKLL